ncbi:MAG: hypothetical protein HYT88_03545 [Candidatus Omnitrophica bacterium]|nr:hypothetical protein [Candidatus Omnitrophota bacterium]
MRLFLVSILAMSLAWPLRGQFGHLHGAMIPGALAASVVALYFPRAEWRRAFGGALIFSAAGFSLGGHFSYGGTIESLLEVKTLQQAMPYLARLFWIGSVWGALGMTFLGFGFSERKLSIRELWLFGGIALFWSLVLGILNWEHLDLFAFSLGLAVLWLHNAFVLRSRIVACFGWMGLIGWGIGFLVAVGLLVAGHHGLLWGSWWQLRDQLIGVCGGLALAGAILWIKQRGGFPETSAHSASIAAVGFLGYILIIPLVNLLDVLSSWRSERPVLSNAGLVWTSLAIVLVSIGLSGYGWKKTKSAWLSDEALHGLLRQATLVFIWSMSVLAIAKETVPLGWQRWESAFSLFLLHAVLLTFTLFHGTALRSRL